MPVTRWCPVTGAGSLPPLAVFAPAMAVLAGLDNVPGVTVNRYRKPTFTRPAPTALRQQIAAENQLVIEGLAD